MAKSVSGDMTTVTRDQLADLLNEDLAREYQAIIAYTVYSQVLKGAEFMSIADQLETHAGQELKTCAHYLSSNRLFRKNAHRYAQASENVRRRQDHVAL